MTRHDAGTEAATSHGAPSDTAVAVDRLVTSGLKAPADYDGPPEGPTGRGPGPNGPGVRSPGPVPMT
ncbi:hypothetical protein [Streptomyces glomeratus]|uniref:Uncharacterized protein n=1 Tax=Streptomyces glomeratus TaxID=284452 RepID=A0ABP6M2K3_9ACTN|nr:hypothetical protein [Streptomyces glomeratus]MCF1511374.1 hypothetical protein [Streptomyces glomeratus]